MSSVNMDIFKELLLDYEDDNLTFSDKIEFRDKLLDIVKEIQTSIDNDCDE